MDFSLQAPSVPTLSDDAVAVGAALSGDMPEIVQDILDVVQVAAHGVSAVFTGNISGLVQDIVKYAGSAKAYTSECEGLKTHVEAVSTSLRDFLTEEKERLLQEKSGKPFEQFCQENY